jgi:hypothetical protein
MGQVNEPAPHSNPLEWFRAMRFGVGMLFPGPSGS